MAAIPPRQAPVMLGSRNHGIPPASLRRLWRLYTLGFGAALLGVVGLALALYGGAADPPRAGPLLWKDDFKQGTGRWQLYPPRRGRLEAEAGALVVEFVTAEEENCALALTEAPATDFTLEVGGAQTESAGALYGLVFDWRAADWYSAVLVNNNGYAAAYHQTGAERRAWFEWQQWPHILPGTESNVVRVDARGGRVVARINDEYLAAAERNGAGRLGLLACPTGAAPGRVVFGWARLWAAR